VRDGRLHQTYTHGPGCEKHRAIKHVALDADWIKSSGEQAISAILQVSTSDGLAGQKPNVLSQDITLFSERDRVSAAAIPIGTAPFQDTVPKKCLPTGC
jgi:hypothetical protein